MILRLLRLFQPGAAATSGARSAVDLPWLSREQIAHLLVVDEGLPQVDWGMADAWIAHEASKESPRQTPAQLRRAVAAAWLDELRDALLTDSRRWRSSAVEGLAPLDGTVGQRVATWAERSLTVIGKAMREIRGDPRTNPIPPIGIIALGSADEYYSFIAHYDDEGEYATSGGVYIRSTADEFPLLAVNAQTTQALEATVAHELTHHALRPDRPEVITGLPTWAEEGLTQMMEELVTKHPNFIFGREMLERHCALWEEIGLEGFAAGDTFHSPEGEQQELSYNLAQALTRSLLSRRRKDFFAFARACRNEGQGHDSASREHLGGTVQELADALLSSRAE